MTRSCANHTALFSEQLTGNMNFNYTFLFGPRSEHWSRCCRRVRHTPCSPVGWSLLLEDQVV